MTVRIKATRLFILFAFMLQVALPFARWSATEAGSARVLDTATGKVVFSIDNADAAGTFALALASDNTGYIMESPVARMTAMPQERVRGDGNRQSVVMALVAMTRLESREGSEVYVMPQDQGHDRYQGWTRGRGT